MTSWQNLIAGSQAMPELVTSTFERMYSAMLFCSGFIRSYRFERTPAWCM